MEFQTQTATGSAFDLVAGSDPRLASWNVSVVAIEKFGGKVRSRRSKIPADKNVSRTAIEASRLLARPPLGDVGSDE